MFVRCYFFDDFVVHNERWMERLFDFSLDEKSFSVGLKVTSRRVSQYIILSRSKLRSSAAISGLSTMINKLVSSAKSRIFGPISVTISFVKSRNRSGP